MPDFNYEGILPETFNQFCQKDALFGRVLKRPGELEQDRAKSLGLGQFVYSYAKGSFIFRGGLAALVCKDAVQLCCERKIWIGGNTFGPRFGCCGRWGPIKAAVDLDGIEKPRQVLEGIEFNSGLLWVDYPFPVFVGPPRRPDSDGVDNCHSCARYNFAVSETESLARKPASAYYQLMNYQDIITIEPGKRGGKPCIRGMRITVYDVLEYLASGMSQEEVLKEFPYLTENDIRACLAYAADREKHLLVVTE